MCKTPSFNFYLFLRCFVIWPTLESGWMCHFCTIMSGAIVSHLTILGIDVLGDGGQLFAPALITFLCCGIVIILHWSKVMAMTKGILNAR